jgi:alkyl hydroperoxide reductase subunit AhpF
MSSTKEFSQKYTYDLLTIGAGPAGLTSRICLRIQNIITRSIIIATGIKRESWECPGEDRLQRKGVAYKTGTLRKKRSPAGAFSFR